MQNDPLLLKHMDIFYDKVNVPWVELILSSYYTWIFPHLTTPNDVFWWRDVLGLNVIFRCVALCRPRLGNLVGFWEDCFFDQPLSMKFSNLFSLPKMLSFLWKVFLLFVTSSNSLDWQWLYLHTMNFLSFSNSSWTWGFLQSKINGVTYGATTMH